MSTAQTQRLVREVARRQQLAAFGQRFRWALLGAAGLYLVLLLGARLLALLPPWFTLQSLWVIPSVALIAALALWRKPGGRQIARMIDERTGSKELFLTAAMIEESPGDFQAIVLEQAEQRAGEVRAAQVVPFAWQRGVREVALAALVAGAAVLWLPQLDPFGHAKERQKIAKEEERLKETKKLTVLRAEQLAATPPGDQVEKALAELDKTFKTAKPDEKEANQKRLEEHQRELGEMWRKVSNETPRGAFEKAAQSFGRSDPKQAEQWKEELRRGETTAVKKELQDIQQQMQKLASMPESADKRALQEQLQQRLNSLGDGLKQQMNSPALNAGLQRAMDQLDLAKLGQLSKEALAAAQESLQLSEQELDKLAQSMKDMQALEQGLQNVQMAKRLAEACKLDGKECQNCKSMSDYAALYAGLCKKCNLIGPGMGKNGGLGAGGKAPEDDSLTSAFKPEKEQGKLAGGKTLLQWETNEVGATGARAEDYREAIRDVKQRVSEAIAAEQVPPGYHSAIQKYFDSLPEK